MREKLSRILCPRRRWLLETYLSLLLFLDRFHRRWQPRARAHWVGYRRRRRRMERPFIVLLFGSAMIVLEPREYALWAAIWGGFISVLVNVYTVYHLVPRKRAHWVKPLS